MKIYEAIDMAVRLLHEHKLDAEGWTVVIDTGATHRLGRCRPSTKTIHLTKGYVLSCDESEVRDTVLHEIAHALTPGARHGPVWKRKCVEIGCKPERLNYTVKTERKFKATCINCNQKYQVSKVRPGVAYWCRCIPANQRHTAIPLKFEYNYDRIKEIASRAAKDDTLQNPEEVQQLLLQLEGADSKSARSIRAKLRRLGHRGGLH